MSLHPLARFEIVVLKDKLPPNDLAQVPASASVGFYRQGATVATTVIVPPSGEEDTLVDVLDVGSIAVGEMIAPILSAGQQLHVNQIVSTSQIAVFNPSAQPITLLSGTRVVPVQRPLVYGDSAGTTSLGSTISTDPATGRASAYLKQTRFDYAVSIPGTATRIYPDAQALPAGLPLNAQDFASLQTAMDSLPSQGGTIFLPAGEWRVPSGGLRITKSVELYGERGTVLRPWIGNQNDQPVIVVDATGLPSGSEVSGVSIHDLAIVNDQALSVDGWLETSYGIVTRSASDTKVTNLEIRNVTIAGMGGDGVHVAGTNGGSGAVVFLRLIAVQSILNKGCGFFVGDATVVEVENCYASGNSLHGYIANRSGVAMVACAAENNCLSTVDRDQKSTYPMPNHEYSYSSVFGAQIRLRTAYPASIVNAHIEDFTTPSHHSRRGLIVENSLGCQVMGGLFVTGVHVQSDVERAVWITNGSGGTTIQGGIYSGSYWNVYVDPGESNVSVSNLHEENGRSMHSGMVIPGVADENRAQPSSSGRGNVVWSTTRERFEYWNGLAWEAL